MSRPNTRHKNKRQRGDDNEDSSIEILRKIHLTGIISSSDISQLYLINKPACQGCRVNSKDSPNCFCGLIPPPNGTRKVGLWQKMPDIIKSLGENPCRDLRSSTDIPAGLTNLGATCYANSILQCLYMNIPFRAGICSVEAELLRQHPVLGQLARLFMQLHSSKMAFIDSAPFIKTLELDNGVQQDSHEFLTLFLSLLERALSYSKNPVAKTVVQDLFRGNVSHVTRCSLCGKDSDASSKLEDFYELELNIKGLDNLDKSLNNYLSTEKLDGENQYFCESCNKRVDATRRIKLISLPSVLNFQLKRYIFLPKTTTKKKITSSFSFPRRLNMGKRLSSPSESNTVYELSAILIHKGTAVNSGHYVAHIKDTISGQWWEFDDEHVSKLGPHPFGESVSTKSEPNDTVNQSNGNKCASHPEDVFSSTDAYMLMYTSVDVNAHTYINDSSLPFHLKKEIEELNASYDRNCEEYQQRKDKQLSYITERRQEVRSIISEAQFNLSDDLYFWVATDWIRQWADSVTPPCIDNSPIQCSHGKVPLSMVTSLKRLSNTAWQKLLSKYGGGPALTNDDYCADCLMDIARNTIRADDYRDQRASLRHLAEAAVAGYCTNGATYLVSKPWLVQWLRRKATDNPCDADAGPTASLMCPHGGLLPEQATGAKRVSVSEPLWSFLCESAMKVKPDDIVLAFPSVSEPCETCTSELTEVACFEDSLRTTKLKQRQNHEKLILGKSLTLSVGCKYFLVPASWLAKWRTFINATGKKKPCSVEPENLQVTIDSLICDKHSRLIERPLELVLKHGTITQRTSDKEGLILIPESDWKFFCEEWNAAENKGIHAEISYSRSSLGKATGSSEDAVVSEELKNSNGDANNGLENGMPFIQTFPEVCDDCIGERESCELMKKLNYCNEDIRVYLVHGKEAPKSIVEASGKNPESDRRASKRSKKTSSGNSISLTVSCTTTIYQLKLMIWEAFGVVKENQKLHKGSTELEGDSSTLADKNIFPGDVLWVKDSEIHENRDIADELSDQNMSPKNVEEGFRGTLLTSGLSSFEFGD